MVLRNDDGSMIFAAYRYIFHCNDALEAEMHAIMQGMALAIQHSDKSVRVQSDSSNALATLTGDTLSRSAYGHLGAEIKAYLDVREFVPCKIGREQHMVAHLLAHYSRTECCTAVWLNSSPPCCEEQLAWDCNPIILE